MDISECGAAKYCESPDFEIILLAAAWGEGPVKIFDPRRDANDPEYQRVVAGLSDPEVTVVSHNTSFERNAFKAFYDLYIEPERVVDTMILCAYNGLPMSLDAAGEAMNLKDKKMREGKALINYFCKPCKPTITNGGRTRNLPEHAPEKWKTFCDYCVRDVEVAQKILYTLKDRWPVSEMERKVWSMDARVNERGVLIDKEFVEQAQRIGDEFTERKIKELAMLTGLENPNSVSQLKEWFSGRGVEIDSLDKKAVSELMASCTDPIVKRVLNLRQLIGKTSTKKYEAMLNCVCADGRVRGLTQYYGASRTGRFAGRMIQLQNLPQNHIEPMTEIRQLVKDGDSETLEMCFDSLPDVLSQLIRSALVAKEGHTLLVADYSAIEARVTAYLAQCQWRLDTFANGGDIYCASASQMFHVPVVKHGENGHLRQRGKVAELALGYGGGVHALETMGGKALGLTEPEMQDIVEKWRLASPEIPKMWRDTEKAAKYALSTGKVAHALTSPVKVSYGVKNGNLMCRLPSGRCLVYWGAHLEDGKIIFWAQNQVTRKWEKLDTWGGKLVENCLTGDTKVVTHRGIKRLMDVTTDDLLWDGREWVSHTGLIYKGEREVISVDGVYMTPDHKILTREGFVNAEHVHRYNRAEVESPDLSWVRREGQTGEMPLEGSVRLRGYSDHAEEGLPEEQILRMLEKGIDIQSALESWGLKQTPIQCMALDEGEMRMPDSPSVEELRGKRYSSLQEMVGELCSLQRRHGGVIRVWADIGQNRCEWELQPRELSMGNNEGAESKSTGKQNYQHTDWANDNSRGRGEIRYRVYNNALPSDSRSSDRYVVRRTGCVEKVYDLMNAGPRHRFAVVSNCGLMIVHNCVQAFARDCLAEAMVRLEDAGYNILFSVHDEVICEQPIGSRWEDMAEIMGQPLAWAPGLYLRADGYDTPFYRKD